MIDVKQHQTVDDSIVCSHLSQVTAMKAAWIFLQSPDFVGFGAVGQDKIDWPPGIELDWRRVSDLRLFGEQGEWHLWQNGDRTWNSRLRQVNEIKKKIIEYPFLWGTQVGEQRDSWTCLTEERGASIWLPVSADACQNLPLRLKVFQILDVDDNGLTGIVDAVLLQICDSTATREILPSVA